MSRAPIKHKFILKLQAFTWRRLTARNQRRAHGPSAGANGMRPRRCSAKQRDEFALKLSLFWADRHFAVGRFLPLDRADYLDHAIVLTERERLLPARPTLDEIRTYLGGAPFSSWTENAQRFTAMDVLTPGDHKAYIRALLYPARLVYSWTTGQMASNDEAVVFTCEHRPPGLDTDLLTRALAYRQAAADPDALFPARAVLPDQVRSCTQFLTDSTS